MRTVRGWEVTVSWGPGQVTNPHGGRSQVPRDNLVEPLKDAREGQDRTLEQNI